MIRISGSHQMPKPSSSSTSSSSSSSSTALTSKLNNNNNSSNINSNNANSQSRVANNESTITTTTNLNSLDENDSNAINTSKVEFRKKASFYNKQSAPPPPPSTITATPKTTTTMTNSSNDNLIDNVELDEMYDYDEDTPNTNQYDEEDVNDYVDEEEDDDDDNDDDDDDDEHEEQDIEENGNGEEDDENFVSPSVQVKHSIKYGYDEKIFELVKGEQLFLISKTNQDWWLCLRLDENLTFFVPASYVYELDIRPQPNIEPPPRPPPPPPPTTSTNLSQFATTINQTINSSSGNISTATTTNNNSSTNNNKPKLNKTKSNAAAAAAAAVATVTASTNAGLSSSSSSTSRTIKPEVKQRHLYNYSNTITNINNNNENNSYMSNRNSNLASYSASVAGGVSNNNNNLSDNDDSSKMYENLSNFHQLSNKLADRDSFNNDNDSSKQTLMRRSTIDQNADAIISDLDECLNREEALFNSPRYLTSSAKNNTIGKSQAKVINSDVTSAAIMSKTSPLPSSVSSTGIDSSSPFQNKQIALNNYNKNSNTEPSNSIIPTAILSNFSSSTTMGSTTPEPDYVPEPIYQNLPLHQGRPSKANSTKLKDYNRVGVINNELSVEADEQLKQETQKSKENENETTSDENQNNQFDRKDDEEEEDTENLIKVPKGWRMGISKCKRKFFFNEFNKEKWYLNYDESGKHYFYNADSQSVWQLPNLFFESSDLDDENGKNSETAHFKRDFDEDLSTFKNLYGRLSIRQTSNDSTSGGSGGGGGVAPIYPVLPSSLPNEEQPRFKKQDSISSLATTTTINYSNRAPSGLNANFKCFKLAENGKKCRRSPENFRVELASTKLLFIKETKGVDKLEMPIDFKGGKCYKIENSKSASNANKDASNSSNNGNNSNKDSSSNKDNNNNNSSNLPKQKQTKPVKDKNLEEILSLIGSSKSGFVVETLKGYKLLLINENVNIINEWVNAINSIILQFRSEYSPIYEGPELLHSTQMHEIEISKPVLQKINEAKVKSNPKKNEKVELESQEEKRSSEDKTSLQDHFKSLLGIGNKMRSSTKRKELPPTPTSNNNFEARFIKSEEISLNYVAQLPSSPLPPLPDRPPPELNKTDIISFDNINGLRKYVLKNILNSFLTKRPTIEQVMNKGYIKECVYGSNLINLCRRDKSNVPIFVEEIIEAIEFKGVDMDGIYRINGNLAEIQKVRHQVDQGKHNFKDFDIHVLCGALKTFFRELEEPLVPYDLHQDFLYSTTITDKLQKFAFIHGLIKQMPIAHRETLRHLCKHLLKVVEQSAQNRMNVQNLALVFGPNLMRSNPINDTNNGFNPHIMTQNILVEYILVNFKELYSYSPNSIFNTGEMGNFDAPISNKT